MGILDPLVRMLVLLLCMFIGLNAYYNIRKMDRCTRHSIRFSYVAICCGCMVVAASMIPALAVYLVGGTALLLIGLTGLMLFNKRRVFERTAQGELLVVGIDDRTRTVQRRTAA